MLNHSFLQEDGSGAGGYAKEMSKEWFEAAERMLAAEVKGLDVLIGTALIPGRAAPRLITEVGGCSAYPCEQSAWYVS